jgi:Hypothetical protein (DUF2513)
MKRDMDLARRVLLVVGECEDTVGVQGGLDLEIDGFTKTRIAYHVMLLDETVLIVGLDLGQDDDAGRF